MADPVLLSGRDGTGRHLGFRSQGAKARESSNLSVRTIAFTQIKN